MVFGFKPLFGVAASCIAGSFLQGCFTKKDNNDTTPSQEDPTGAIPSSTPPGSSSDQTGNARGTRQGNRTQQQQHIAPAASSSSSTTSTTSHDRFSVQFKRNYVMGKYGDRSMQDFIAGITKDPSFFINDFNTALQELHSKQPGHHDYQVAIVFPKVDSSTVGQVPCRFVLLFADLKEWPVNGSWAEEHGLRTTKSATITFQSNSSTAWLVLPAWPKNKSAPAEFMRIGLFMKSRKHVKEKTALWQKVGQELSTLLQQNKNVPYYLNTHGGYPWLHVRVEAGQAKYWPNADSYFM